METLKKLEIIRLIKELDFVESEYNYKSEMIKQIDIEFKKQVENILDSKPDLKDLFTSNVEKISQIFTNKIINNDTRSNLSQDETIEEKDQKLKSLYRTIVKTTHPDVSKDENLKEIYLEATKAYEDNNLYPIMSICNKLKIPFEINEEETKSIKNQILALKMRTQFLETTYTWQWYTNIDDQVRNQIVLEFIQSQIF